MDHQPDPEPFGRPDDLGPMTPRQVRRVQARLSAALRPAYSVRQRAQILNLPRGTVTRFDQARARAATP